MVTREEMIWHNADWLSQRRSITGLTQLGKEFHDFLNGQQSADHLPWFHKVTLITKLPDQPIPDWDSIYKLNEDAILEEKWDKQVVSLAQQLGKLTDAFRSLERGPL